jgi:hypothetical protein
VSERLPGDIREIAADHLLAHCRLGLAEPAVSFAEPATYGQVRFHWASGSAYATACASTSPTPPGRRPRSVEWVIHQLDLTAYLPGDRLAPTDAALALTVRTLDELTGTAVRPMAWSPATYIAKAAGRIPLDQAERRLLGDRAGAFPALG